MMIRFMRIPFSHAGCTSKDTEIAEVLETAPYAPTWRPSPVMCLRRQVES
jgi:hypothetical protein